MWQGVGVGSHLLRKQAGKLLQADRKCGRVRGSDLLREQAGSLPVDKQTRFPAAGLLVARTTPGPVTHVVPPVSSA